MAFSQQDVEQLTTGAASVLGSDGDRIGELIQLYTSDETGQPAWVTVKTGLFGSQESFVPLAGASRSGQDLQVPFTKDTIKKAPRVDAGRHLSVEEEEELHRYYSSSLDGGQRSDTTTDTSADETTNTTSNDTREVGDSDHAATDRDDQSPAEDRAPGSLATATGRSNETSSVRDFPAASDTESSADRSDAGSAVMDRKRPQSDPDADELRRDAPRRRAEVMEEPDSVGGPAVVVGEDDRGHDPQGDSRSDDEDVNESAGRNSSTEHPSGEEPQQGLSAGERTTHERRYIVTERVVQSVEEIPDDSSR